MKPPGDFTWRDGERTIRFSADALESSPTVLSDEGWDRFELLSTERALSGAPAGLPQAAARVHLVPPGAVNEVSAKLIGQVGTATLVALGGGRVIDTAKAISAVKDGQVAAIPTTLSGAEMTAIHKLPDGHEAERLIRPALVFADPEAMTAQPERERRASALNALAHAADSLPTPLAHPVSRWAALEAARLIARGLDDPVRHRDLALGSLLAGYAIDTAHFCLHHVICQSLVRALRIPHAETNAAVLPRVVEAFQGRARDDMDSLAEVLDVDRGALAARIEELGGGGRSLGELGAERDSIDDALDLMEARRELGMTPDPPDRAELRRIVESAW